MKNRGFKTLLVTGGAGFIGSNFIHYMMDKYPEYKIINLDKLTYAGNLENLRDVENNKNYQFVKGDIADNEIVSGIFKNNKVDKHTFYNELNKFSYYNSFFRVKDELIKKGLIKIEVDANKKYIVLTEKGLNVYNKLVEINKIINNSHVKN